MKFVVEKEIFEKLPTACFGVVVAKGIDNGKSYPTVDALLDESIAAAAAHFEGKKVKEEPEILPYREAFRALGINPNKFMCSIEALFTRIAKGKGMPHINPIVDLGNAVSLKYTLPMGAHDLSAGSDDICVRLARVRTRRWTWRQSEHGKIEADSSYIFFPIDGFTDFNKEQVLAAREELLQHVKEIFGCEAIVGFVDAEHPEMDVTL